MVLDTKLNKMQHSAGQLKKLAAGEPAAAILGFQRCLYVATRVWVVNCQSWGLGLRQSSVGSESFWASRRCVCVIVCAWLCVRDCVSKRVVFLGACVNVS
jgi:hypothetical protein